MNTHRYELALGMASGVAVTVISDGTTSNTQFQEKEITSDMNEIQSTLTEVVEGVEAMYEDENRQDIIVPDSFQVDPKTSTSNSVVLTSVTELPQQLSQEVFNTQTGVIEQAEIVSEVQAFETTQGNIFTLSDPDFSGNHLSLEPDDDSDDFVTSNSPLPETIIEEDVPDSGQVIECTLESAPKKAEKSKASGAKKKNQKRPFKCPQCDKVYTKSSHLNQHIVVHTGEKPFRCEECGQMFTQAKSLYQHRNEKHVKEKLFKCSVCTASFTAKRGLVRHMAIHDANQPFHCAYCSDKFATKLLYKNHLKDEHANVLRPEETVITIQPEDTIIQIPEGTVVENGLNISQLTDAMLLQSVTEKEKDKSEFFPRHAHLCPQCSKSFKKPSDLVRHMRIHTGEKPFKCETCGKAFTVKSTLDSHMKTHTGEKNFSCHVCNSLFATKGSLKVHIRLHTGVRPFKCPHCELCFRTSGHRKSHMASHFKEGSSRKKKNRPVETQSFEVVKDSIQEVESVPVVSLSEEVVNLVQPSIQLSNGSQANIQLPTSAIINPNTQLTIMDPSLMSKSFHIDASILQQLQQHFNFNITITPAIPDQLNGKTVVDSNQTTQILNVDANAPANSGTFTINPNMIIHQLGFTISPPQQTELQPSENVTLIIPEAKNSGDEMFQNSTLFDSQVLTLDGTVPRDSDLLDVSKTSTQEVLINNTGVTTLADINATLNQVTCELVHECDVCNKVFKTAALLEKHSKVHKEKSKSIYHCETCNKDFKKKNQFTKHLQSHQ